MEKTQRLQPYDVQGLNIGTWPEITADQFITPTNQFFRRNHASIPSVDPVTWRLEVQGLVNHSAVYSLDQLIQDFPRRDLAATLVCAGLRRAEFLALGPLPGELPWGSDAASTGQWSGVRLADVLRAVGVADEARHVEFVGLDEVDRHGQQFGFGGSIELAKALSDEVILATHLNDVPLPPAHGFPLRAIVPGWIGARSVKWLGRITVLAHPSNNYFQTKAYRIQPNINPADAHDVTAGTAMGGVPLNAVIVEPLPETVVPAGPVRVRGWALGAECQPLTGVEVSANGGLDWVRAQTIATGDEWTWTFWEAVVHLVPGAHVLFARAANAGNTMPAKVNDVWNVKGYGNNAWYQVSLTAS